MDSSIGATELPTSLLIQSRPRRSPAFLLALTGATLLHLAALLTLSIEPPQPPPIPETAMEVMILTESGYSTAYAAADAALAQRSQTGASPDSDAARSSTDGESEDNEPDPVEARSEPDPPADTQNIAPPPAAEPVPVPARPEPTEVLAAEPIEEQPLDLPRAPSRIDAASILASRGQEIERLTANLEARSTAYAKRVRRKSISASTREFRYASYLGAWARKVERIGNLNYPQAARDEHLYGSLILHVAVRSDGSVESIRVVRSSGYDQLDEAAIQIVELAAPYSPFPDDIAAETDVLDIIRTWQFMRGDVLGWER